MAIYGYARCSTTDERQDIDRQIRELSARGAERVFSEYASGAAHDREELANVFTCAQEGDTIIATEVSRLARSLHHLCHILEDAKARKIKLTCGSVEVDFTSGKSDCMSLAMVHIMGVFAEMERSQTIERIKSGIANAKANGTRMGRPRKTAADVPAAVKELLPAFKAGKFNKTEYARQAGVSRPALYKYLNLLEKN